MVLCPWIIRIRAFFKKFYNLIRYNDYSNSNKYQADRFWNRLTIKIGPSGFIHINANIDCTRSNEQIYKISSGDIHGFLFETVSYT